MEHSPYLAYANLRMHPCHWLSSVEWTTSVLDRACFIEATHSLQEKTYDHSQPTSLPVDCLTDRHADLLRETETEYIIIRR
jgi:hypothetical protein